jgi:hypothetical protein
VLAVEFWLTVTRFPATLDTVVPPGRPNPLTGSPVLRDVDRSSVITLLPTVTLPANRSCEKRYSQLRKPFAAYVLTN